MTLSMTAQLGARTRAWTGGAIALLAACAPVSAQLAPNEKPEEIRGLELQDRRGETLPLGTELVDSEGRAITLGDVFEAEPADAPVIVVMAYHRCPLLCPKVMGELAKAVRGMEPRVGEDVKVCVISFDPRDGQVEAAESKANAMLWLGDLANDTARDGWWSLVGEADATRRVSDSLGFAYRYLRESGEYSHPGVIYVTTADGRVSRAVRGLNAEPRDVELAVIEASNGQLGDALDSFILWCYHFDPNSGEYVLAAFKVMQIAGAATAVALAGFVGVLVWQDRRRKAARNPRDDQRVAPGAAPAVDAE